MECAEGYEEEQEQEEQEEQEEEEQQQQDEEEQAQQEQEQEQQEQGAGHFWWQRGRRGRSAELAAPGVVCVEIAIPLPKHLLGHARLVVFCVSWHANFEFRVWWCVEIVCAGDDGPAEQDAGGGFHRQGQCPIQCIHSVPYSPHKCRQSGLAVLNDNLVSEDKRRCDALRHSKARRLIQEHPGW